MRNLALAVLVASGLAFVACGATREMSPAEAGVAAGKKGIANGVCPVMGNVVDLDDPDLFADYKGQRIGFCCGPCKPKFLKDPEKYMKVLEADPAKYGYHAP